VPFAGAAAGAPEPDAEARAFLERAIAEYERAVALEPENVHARLGLAWCRDQAGDDEAARRDYREILERAWEGDAASHAMFGTYVSSEAIGYLLPLLDPQADADEIAELVAKRETLESRPRAITPIAIPLADHLEPADLVLAGPGVRFDLDGSGRLLAWQWISQRAAWLVWDPEGRGRIESALQLMGSRSFLLFPEDGYDALGLLDDDGDGSLRGRELRGLALWADSNADGRSQPGEVQPLAAWGVVGLSCRSRLHAQGIRWAPGGVELSDGRRRDSFDLVMATTGLE
jgi:tetratricopeptide (TPR) repeat protein